MVDFNSTPFDPNNFTAGVEIEQSVSVTTDHRVVLFSNYSGEFCGARTWIVFTPDEARQYGKLLIEGADAAEAL